MKVLNENVEKNKRKIESPYCIEIYNKKMNGVDANDQFRVSSRRFYSTETLHRVFYF